MLRSPQSSPKIRPITCTYPAHWPAELYLLECTRRGIKQFYYTTIFLCTTVLSVYTNVAISGTCLLKSSVPDPRGYDADPHPRIRIQVWILLFSSVTFTMLTKSKFFSQVFFTYYLQKVHLHQLLKKSQKYKNHDLKKKIRIRIRTNNYGFGSARPTNLRF